VVIARGVGTRINLGVRRMKGRKSGRDMLMRNVLYSLDGCFNC
jgi:hypothetical protein